MPLSNDTTRFNQASEHHSSSTIALHNAPRHPHPLRSHSRPENILAMEQLDNDANSIRPDSAIINDSLQHPWSRRRSFQSFRSGRDEEDVFPPLPSPTSSKGFVGPAQTGFGNVAFAADWPVIPVRPPLRPTASFGPYSYSEDGSISLKEKDVEITVEEISLEEKRTRVNWRDLVAVGCLCLLNFTCDMSATAMSTALPYIAADLHLSSVEMVWASGSYLLASALSQPLFMRLPSALGSKALLLLGLILFAIGNTISGLADNGSILLFGRSVEGFGAGAITVLSQLIASQLCRDTKLLQQFGPSGLHLFWSGIALGPIIGGVIAQNVSWRGIFWMQLHPSIIGLAALSFLLQLPFFKAGAGFRRTLKVDFLGWLLLSASISPIMVAMSWAGTRYSWTSWHTLLPLIVGLLSLSGWCLYNRYRMEPILPISIFYSWSARISCFGATVLGILITSIIYFPPTSTSRLAATLPMVVFSLITGLLINHRWTTPIAWTIITLATGLLLLPNHTLTAFLLIPIGLSCGSLLPTLNNAIEKAASNDDETIHAAPLFLFFISLGAAIGVVGGQMVLDVGLDIWTFASALSGFCLVFCLVVGGDRRFLR